MVDPALSRYTRATVKLYVPNISNSANVTVVLFGCILLECTDSKMLTKYTKHRCVPVVIDIFMTENMSHQVNISVW